MATILTDLSLRLYAQTSELKNGLKEASGSVKKLNSETKDAGKQISGNFQKMSKEAGSSLGDMVDGLGGLGPAGDAAGGAMKAMSVGAKMLNTALGPIGIIIGVVALAVKALMSYFTNTTEGAQKFAKIMGFIQGIAGFLSDAFTKLGEMIVWAFENPKEAIKQLWEAIKQNLWNRWEGLVNYFKNSFELIKNGLMGTAMAIKGLFDDEAKKESKQYFSAMGDNLKEMGKAVVQVMTGFTTDDFANAAKLLGKYAEEAIKRGELGAMIAAKELALRIALINASGKLKKLEVEISQLKTDVIDEENKTNEERLAINEELKKKIKQKGDIELAMANEALSIEINKSKLSKDEIGSAEKIQEARNNVFDIQTKINGELRETVEKEKEIKAKIEANAKAEKDKADAAKKLEEERVKSAKDYANKIVAENEKIKNSESLAGRLENIKNIYEEELQLLNEKFTEEEKMNKEYLAAKSALEETQLRDMNALELEEAKKTMDKKLEMAYMAADGTMGILTAVSDFQSAAKNKELAQAGDNEAKKNQIEKKYAKKAQKISFMQAIINGAVAITKALADLGPIAGPIFAGIIGVQTAAQLALIGSQSFAKGGIVYGPTQALVGEYPGARSNPEVIAPLDKLQNILSNSNGFGGNVRFQIEGRNLVGVLQKESKISQLY